MNIPRSLKVKRTELDSSHIPLPLRREVLQRDKKRCRFCSEPTKYLCHDLVKCRGGKTTPDNLLTCCQSCRREKGELTAAEFHQVKLKEENIDKEMTMRIQVFFSDSRRPPVIGEVDSFPAPNTRAFYLRHPGNGKRSLIYTEPGMLIDELDATEKGGNH